MAEPARIWVVDDDHGVRFVLATALREAGYAVEAFDSAQSAMSALESQPVPDLLFTDVRMPGGDGLALLERLKAQHPALPVVVMSAYTDLASTAGAFRGGAHEFLSKPFDLDHAVALAARALPAQWTVTPVSYAGAPVPTDVIFPFRPSGRNEPYALALASPSWTLVVAGDPLNRVQIAAPTASR